VRQLPNRAAPRSNQVISAFCRKKKEYLFAILLRSMRQRQHVAGSFVSCIPRVNSAWWKKYTEFGKFGKHRFSAVWCAVRASRII